jgi:hypothetical protein
LLNVILTVFYFFSSFLILLKPLKYKNMEAPKPNYNCGQDELYGGGDLVITSLLEELASFTAFKSKYTLIYATALKAELQLAIGLPGLDQRLAEQEVARINLLSKLNECLDNLNALRLYIRDAYPNSDIRLVRLQEAGFDDYEFARKANWEKLRAIMDNANAFISNHEAELLAGDNMPAGFKASFEALQITVQPDIVTMLNLRENNKQATSAKINANNDIFEKIMDVCEDGAYIFRNDAAKRAQFVWTSVLEVITPPGAAGMKGEVRDSVTKVLIEGALVRMSQTGLPEVSTLTGANGKYDFGNLPVGDYEGKVLKDLYDSTPFTVTITTGVTSTRNFEVVPI